MSANSLRYIISAYRGRLNIIANKARFVPRKRLPLVSIRINGGIKSENNAWISLALNVTDGGEEQPM